VHDMVKDPFLFNKHNNLNGSNIQNFSARSSTR
jgi:hypothetical protein